MSWARLDDRANEHRKQLEAGAEACWLWSCSLMYCNRQDARDGFIPEAMVPMLYPFKRPKVLAQKLVDSGLWEKVDGGYLIHGYHEWNPTREEVESYRSKGRERASKSYQLRAKNRDESSREETAKHTSEDKAKKHVSSGSTPLHSKEEIRIPPMVPLEGDKPERVKTKRQSPKVTRPEDFAPLPRQRDTAQRSGLDLTAELEKFKAHHDARGSVFRDWHRALDTWLLNAPEFRRNGPAPGFSEHEARQAGQRGKSPLRVGWKRGPAEPPMSATEQAALAESALRSLSNG